MNIVLGTRQLYKGVGVKVQPRWDGGASWRRQRVETTYGTLVLECTWLSPASLQDEVQKYNLCN